MKYPALALALLLFACGCATHHSAPTAKQISDKQEELEILGGETDMLAKHLIHLQQDLASKGSYPTEAQVRDLDHAILVLNQAKARLAAENKRLHDEHHVSDGPY